MLPIVIAVVVAALVGFGSGWGVKGWKDGATVAIIKSEKADIETHNVILQSANDNCAIDIEGIKKGVAEVVAHAQEREHAASDAMAAADLKIAQRKGRIKIAQLPPIAATPDAQCAAIFQEQIDYVRGRENGD